MGNYSFMCVKCADAIQNPWNDPTVAVAVLPFAIIAGEYDGYGSLKTSDGTLWAACRHRREEAAFQHPNDEGQEADWYHAGCWWGETTYTGGSDLDPDQGDGPWDDD